MPKLSVGCPGVPDSVARDSLVAVVEVTYRDAHGVNHNSFFTCRELFKRSTASGRNEPYGVRIYLHRVAGRPTYSFGKGYLLEPGSNSGSAQVSEDDFEQMRSDTNYNVYLPIHSAVKQLFELVPDREADCWRLDVTSTAAVTVAGVDIRKPQIKGSPKKQSLPHAVYLDASDVTIITFGDIKVRLWLNQSPSEVLQWERDFKTTTLHQGLQEVQTRHEDWAQRKYIWDHAQPQSH
jgi:hypothetical protein